MVLSAARGLFLYRCVCPTAYAVGCILPPLRGLHIFCFLFLLSIAPFDARSDNERPAPTICILGDIESANALRNQPADDPPFLEVLNGKSISHDCFSISYDHISDDIILRDLWHAKTCDIVIVCSVC